MSPSLQRLVSLVPPPQTPVATGSPEDWQEVETEIGARLPQDFKNYISVYGAGQWADFFGIRDPFYQWTHPQASKSWRQWMETRLGGLEEMRRKWPNDTAPFKPHPAPEGLLAFGYDDNGGTLCWQMRGEPDAWPIICLDPNLSQEYDAFAMSLTEFLASLMAQQIVPVTYPADFFPIPQPAFRPYVNE